MIKCLEELAALSASNPIALNTITRFHVQLWGTDKGQGG